VTTSESQSSGKSAQVLRVVGLLGRVLSRAVVFVMIWLGLLLLMSAVIIHYYWGQVTVVQVLLNLMAVQLDGGGGPIVWVCIFGIGLFPLLLTIALTSWPYFQRRRNLRKKRDGGQVASPWFGRTTRTVIAAALIVGGPAAFVSTVEVTEYVTAANSEYDVGDHYVEPKITSDEDKRNLVLVYLESAEATLGEEGLVEKNPYASLEETTKEADGWQSVEGLQEYDGSGWTMAGITSTQCGFPLNGILSAANSGSYSEVGVGEETYLGGTTCLGDLLKDSGYTSVFLGGANPSFAAKETLLTDHGYSEVNGRSDWVAAGEPESSFRSDWGLSDQRLMEYAKDEIDDLHAESEQTGEPFNLSVLTLDTHEPVHVHDYCNVDTADEMTSVYACSMEQVAGFVDHMEEQGYLEDTAVVLMGDHLKPSDAGDAFHEELDEHPNRTLFNRIWIPGEDDPQIARSGVDQINMFPTILEIAGLEVADQQAGIGVSAFTSEVPEDSAQSLPDDAYAELLKSGSPQFYRDAWVGEIGSDGGP